LLKLFMVYKSLGVEFFGSFRYKIMSLGIGIVWSLLYVFVFLLFCLSALLLWLGIVRLCWIGVGRVGTLVSFLTLGETVSVFPKCDVGLHRKPLFCWGISLLFLVSPELFSWNGVESYQKLLLSLSRWSSVFCLCFC
jgi:hypothetical protein